jgi:hypothetical protein
LKPFGNAVMLLKHMRSCCPADVPDGDVELIEV